MCREIELAVFWKAFYQLYADQFEYFPIGFLLWLPKQHFPLLLRILWFCSEKFVFKDDFEGILSFFGLFNMIIGHILLKILGRFQFGSLFCFKCFFIFLFKCVSVWVIHTVYFVFSLTNLYSTWFCNQISTEIWGKKIALCKSNRNKTNGSEICMEYYYWISMCLIYWILVEFDCGRMKLLWKLRYASRAFSNLFSDFCILPHAHSTRANKRDEW